MTPQFIIASIILSASMIAFLWIVLFYLVYQKYQQAMEENPMNYRLKKDLPHAKAGSVLIYDQQTQTYTIDANENTVYTFSESELRELGEWFEPITPPVVQPLTQQGNPISNTVELFKKAFTLPPQTNNIPAPQPPVYPQVRPQYIQPLPQFYSIKLVAEKVNELVASENSRRTSDVRTIS